VVAVEKNRAAVHDLAPVPVDLTAQVIDQKIAVDQGGKPDQRLDHLHAGAHGVDHVRTRIQSEVGLEDVIGHHSEPFVPDAGPDVDAEDKSPGGCDQSCGVGVVADTHFYGPPVATGDILPDTPFNMFIVTHYPEIR